MYCDPLMVHGGHKITARQRWTPTQMQLQILESIFDQGNGTPSKQKIKDITAELSQHGQISETNVYNWFQNRRARSKRKQAASLPNNAESEAEADEESPTEKKPKSDGPLHQNMATRAHNPERISEMHRHLDMEHEQNRGMMYGSNSDNSSKSSGGLGQMSFYANVMSNPSTFGKQNTIITQHVNLHISYCTESFVVRAGIDQFLGKVETPGSFSQFRPGESFDMYG